VRIWKILNHLESGKVDARLEATMVSEHPLEADLIEQVHLEGTNENQSQASGANNGF
jgi:hypothetical protein